MAELAFVIVVLGSLLVYQVLWSVGTGWYRLSKLYETPTRLGSKIGAGPISMNDDRQNGRLRLLADVTATPQGLSLSMPWFFTLACPPLLIPWKEFALVPKVELKGDHTRVKMHLRNGDTLTVMQPEYLAMEPYLHHLPHRPIPARAPAASARIA